MLFLFVVLALVCFFLNGLLKKHIIILSKCTSRLADKGMHIKLVASDKINGLKYVIKLSRSYELPLGVVKNTN